MKQVDTIFIASKSPRAKEVLRAKEVFLNIVYDKSESDSDAQGLVRYFMQYALAARLNK